MVDVDCGGCAMVDVDCEMVDVDLFDLLQTANKSIKLLQHLPNQHRSRADNLLMNMSCTHTAHELTGDVSNQPVQREGRTEGRRILQQQQQ